MILMTWPTAVASITPLSGPIGSTPSGNSTFGMVRRTTGRSLSCASAGRGVKAVSESAASAMGLIMRGKLRRPEAAVNLPFGGYPKVTSLALLITVPRIP